MEAPLLTRATDRKYPQNIINPKRPKVSLKMYMERLKKAQTTVKNRKTGRLERAREELIKAKKVIINPIMAMGMIFRNGSGRSMIMVAIRVMNITAFIPSSNPRDLAINAAKTIKMMDLNA